MRRPAPRASADWTCGLGGGGGGGLIASDDDSKRSAGCISLQPTRDGRTHVSLQVAATLSRGKLAFIATGVALLAWLIASPMLGFSGGETAALRRRLNDLELAMGRKLSWLAQHRGHLKSHLGGSGTGAWVPVPHPDGRAHLLSDPDGISRLAEAVAPETRLPPIDDHYMCGEEGIVTEADVMRKKLAIAVITWAAPLSLRNSMESWRRGGLLDIVDERMIFINSPTEEDRGIAKEYGFDVYTTPERGGNIMAGPALAYLMGNATAEHVLFMEKDFVLSSDRATMLREVYHAQHLLARGVHVVRLRGKTDFPAEGMPDCCAAATPPNCPFTSKWRSGGYFGDHMNWLHIFCDPDPLESGFGRVAKCASEPSAPDTYCFGSSDSNWSNNPLIMSRDWFNAKLRDVSFNGEKAWEVNAYFEFNGEVACACVCA